MPAKRRYKYKNIFVLNVEFVNDIPNLAAGRTISPINSLNLKWSRKQSPELASGDGEGEEDDQGQAEDRDQEDRGRRCALH